MENKKHTVVDTVRAETGKDQGSRETDGVDKRIDEYALVVKNGGTVYDLTRLEHAYAPPFSSAKDPVAVSGYVAGNILSGKMTPLYWRELRDADLSKVTLIDVGHQPAAIQSAGDNIGRQRVAAAGEVTGRCAKSNDFAENTQIYP